jgi:hypothetical protein
VVPGAPGARSQALEMSTPGSGHRMLGVGGVRSGHACACMSDMGAPGVSDVFGVEVETWARW